MSAKINIAILGATSHIAKGLIYNFTRNGYYQLSLFARSTHRVIDFLKTINSNRSCTVADLETFNTNNYDVIINCIGIADPRKLKAAGIELFYLTEKFDAIILEYLTNHSTTLFINFSSGAVYGTIFDKPISRDSIVEIEINNIVSSDLYRISKLNSEVKHRAFEGRIIDLRIFSYFSRFIDISSKFLMTEIIECIRKRSPLVTGTSDIIRDYVHPDDLFTLIQECIDSDYCNAAYDVYSAAPVKKSEILSAFSSAYGLKIDIRDEEISQSATGAKIMYYSMNKAAENIGYQPRYRSIDTLLKETGEFLKLTNN